MADTISISPYLTLTTVGTVAGIDCGKRPSGVTVARQEGAANVHVLYPKTHSKVVETAVGGLAGVAPKGAGRIWVAKDSPEVQGIVERVEGAIANAKVARRDAPVVFPVLDGVTTVVEGGEVVVRMVADRYALDGIKGGLWDDGRSAFVAPAARAKAVAKALKDLGAVRAARAEASAALARAAAAVEAARIQADFRRAESVRLTGVLVERLRGVLGATALPGASARLAFPYDQDLVALARSLPGSAYEPAARTWTATATTDAGADLIVAAALRIADAIPALREARDAEAARRAADRQAEATARFAANPWYVERSDRAPAVGDVRRLHDPDEVIVVTSLGKQFRGDDALSSLGGPIGAEGEWCRRVYHRTATPDEVAALETREAEARAVARAARSVSEMVARVQREGEMVDLGREPEGEVLLRNDRSAIVGYATRLVLDGEGGLWTVTYDGTDGGTWGMHNLGYNTRGRRLRVTSGEVATLREDIRTARIETT